MTDIDPKSGIEVSTADGQVMVRVPLAESASEFSRSSTRLSAWDRTFSGIFCGRWVEIGSYRPNLRPSAAIRTACPAAPATSGLPVAVGFATGPGVVPPWHRCPSRVDH